MTQIPITVTQKAERNKIKKKNKYDNGRYKKRCNTYIMK